jgi:hypothetical protein
MSAHRVSICMTLRHISPPFDAGKTVELTWQLPSCGEISGGGEMTWRVDACDAGLYMIGDKYVMQATRTS